jgi:outer membrane protein
MNKITSVVLCLFLAHSRLACAEDLLTVYQQAIEADPTLKSAGIKTEIGAAQKGQAFGEMLPQVTASANWSANNQRQSSSTAANTSNYHGTRYTLSLSQTVIDFAKFWNWRKAQEIEDQYSSELTEAQHDLMVHVVEKYFGVLEAEDKLSFLQTEQQATEKQLEQVNRQYAKLLVKITDLYDVEARLDQIKASEIEAETILTTAIESLKELTNTTPATLYRLRDSIEYQHLEGNLDDWIAVAKSENPTLSVQLHSIEAAGSDVAVQKSRYLPVVDAQFNYYDTNTGYQSANIGQTETQVAAINVNVPIFTGGVTTHRLFEAKHRLELSKTENEAKIRALIKETSDSYLSTNAKVRRIDASQKALESTAKARLAKETGFRYGVETMSDMLDAQQQEFKAKKELSKAKYSYIKNRIRFMQATGLINEDNLSEVNSWLQAAPKQPKEAANKS